MAEGEVQLTAVAGLVLVCNLRKCYILSCHLQGKGRYKALPMLKKECTVRIGKKEFKTIRKWIKTGQGCTADGRCPSEAFCSAQPAPKRHGLITLAPAAAMTRRKNRPRSWLLWLLSFCGPL